MALYDDAPSSVDGNARVNREREMYVLAVYARLRQHASRSQLTSADADDAVHRCIVRLLGNLTLLRVRYRAASSVADALWASGPADHRRAERVQRGQGARLIDGPDGSRVAQRQLVSMHTPHAEAAIAAESRRDGIGVDAFERAEHLEQLEATIGNLPAMVRRLLWLVHVEGHSVTKAADIVWCSRGHASRLLSGVRSQLEHLVDAA